MLKDLMVDVASRPERGKNVARRLRRDGKVPAVVYGMSRPPVTVSVNPKIIAGILTSDSGSNTVFQLCLDGKENKRRHVMIRELQKDPVNGALVHVDFLRVDMDRKVDVEVPLETTGVAFGVKTEGGFMDFVVRTVQLSCLPVNIPAHLVIDVTEMKMNDVFRAGNLELEEDVELLTDPSQALVVVSGRAEEEEEVAAEAEAEAGDAEAPTDEDKKDEAAGEEKKE